jgi:hypothetical protein
MSYAIAPTFEANKIGVRRAYTLGRIGLRGAPDDLALQMIADGYDISTITTLTDNNATDAQLQNLYDNYGAGTPEFAQAANQLLMQLTGGMAGGAVSPGSSAPVPTTISTEFGIFDLATKSGWDAAASAINATQQLVRQAAAINPQDPAVVSNVNQFNSAVADFANYYAGAVGQPSSVSQITLSGLGDVSVGQALWNVLGPSGGLLNVIYQIYLWARNYIATKQAIQQTTATAAAATATQGSATMLLQQANALVSQANALPPAQSAQAAQLRAQAATLQAQASSLLALPLTAGTPQPVSLTTWFENNTWIIAVLVGAAVAIPLIKKL